MRVLIVSDIHGNPWALEAVEKAAGTVDYLICAGDAVSYGPLPRAAIAWLQARKAVMVRGNHDHTAAFNAAVKASPAKQPLAQALRDWTRAQLDDEELGWLQRLPLSLVWEAGGTRFAAVHATPPDPLYDYSFTPQLSPEKTAELVKNIDADVLITGHTHLPFLRGQGRMQLVNPGSVGQPLDGDRRAAFALWEDGRLTLQRAEYDTAPLCAALDKLPLAGEVKKKLIGIIEKAGV